MPVDPNRARVSCAYFSDDTSFYSFTTSHNRAVAAGLSSGAGYPPLPKLFRPRLVHGVQINPTGRDIHASLVVEQTTSTLWDPATTTFNLLPHGIFQITGRTGERRTQGANVFDGIDSPPNQRVVIGYTGDQGEHYSIVTSRNHAAAVGAGPPASDAVPFPRGWTPRHYNCIASDLSGSDQKCQLVEPNHASTAWVSDSSFNFTVNGLGLFHSTGRTDEKTHRGAPPGP